MPNPGYYDQKGNADDYRMETIEVLVDNEIAVQNVTKMAQAQAVVFLLKN